MPSKTAAPLTPELSRMARQELGGMSQTAVSKASGVQAYIIKQWETGKFRPPVAALEKLREYYEREGVDFAELAGHAAAVAEPPRPAAAARPSLPAGVTHAPRPGFFIANDLPAEVLDTLMQKLGENDDRIGELVAESFETGFFGGMTDATEGKVRELFAALAESHLLFRFLQGRNIIGAAPTETSTIGDYLAQWVRAESSAAPVLIAPEAQPRDLAAPRLLTHEAGNVYTIDAQEARA